jgi:hypothetical protein
MIPTNHPPTVTTSTEFDKIANEWVTTITIKQKATQQLFDTAPKYTEKSTSNLDNLLKKLTVTDNTTPYSWNNANNILPDAVQSVNINPPFPTGINPEPLKCLTTQDLLSLSNIK